MTTFTSTYAGKDNNYGDQTTVYWFDVDFGDEDSGMFGVVESGGYQTFVDCDGCPIGGLSCEYAVRHLLEQAVTDAMRAE